MKVCLIANQIAAWGKIGGFGTAVRSIGAGLARRGVEVSAVVPRRGNYGQAAVEQLDGITVYGTSARETLTSGRIFRRIGADVYHSLEPTIASYLAQRAAPRARHIVTCIDPRGILEHVVELRYTNYKRRLIFPVTWYYEASHWVKQSVRRASLVLSGAPFLHGNIKRLYGEDVEPIFIPPPMDVPATPLRKSAQPMCLFVGRWDHRKRIELFFELAAASPQVRFVAVGQAHDKSYDRKLRQAYSQLPNVEMPGFLSRFGGEELYELYAQAWILVNTAAREGLPYTFCEALGFGCALLSGLNPDKFASRFGYHAEDGDFVKGLRWLLAGGRWRMRGEAGTRFVRRIFSEEHALDLHVKCYEHVLAGRDPAKLELVSEEDYHNDTLAAA